MNRSLFLLFILFVTASSLLVVKPAHSSVTKPSVPEFTVQLIDSSYDKPTTYSIDPYTGKNVTHYGCHVESRTIEVKIKNQPFVSYYNESSGWTINFYYNIRYKGHYSEDWTEIWLTSDGYPRQNSESNYTVFSFQGEYSPTEGLEFKAGSVMTTFPSDAQVDFQVEAMIGYFSRKYAGNYGPASYPYVLTGETSGWSETQTLTISAPDSTITPEIPEQPDTEPDPQSEPEPHQPNQLTIIAAVALVVVPIVAGLGLIRLRKK